MKIITISHPLNKAGPLYPGTPGPEFEQFRSIKKGDSSNSTNASLNVHTGTHIDLPLHFCEDGTSLAEFSGPEYLIYPAYCIEIKKTGDEPLEIGDFSHLANDFPEAGAILIKTGSGEIRGKNDEYEKNHPWVHPSLPAFLKAVFPNLKLFGLDTISISSPGHREEGREAHRQFLCGERPVLLLEDADLSGLSQDGIPFRLRIYPFFYEKLDASPVIALAETCPGDL